MSTDIVMGQAFDLAVNDLERIIARLTTDRSIRVEACPDGRWCAMTSEDRIVFPPCPHLDTVERFVRAFAEKERVRVDEESVSVAWSYVQVLNGFSVRVPDNAHPCPLCNTPVHPGKRHDCPRGAFSLTMPDNVISIGGR